jgi:hypothetical protein
VSAVAGFFASWIGPHTTEWDHALFVVLVVISTVSFVVLLASGPIFARSWWRLRHQPPQPEIPPVAGIDIPGIREERTTVPGVGEGLERRVLERFWNAFAQTAEAKAKAHDAGAAETPDSAS